MGFIGVFLLKFVVIQVKQVSSSSNAVVKQLVIVIFDVYCFQVVPPRHIV